MKSLFRNQINVINLVIAKLKLMFEKYLTGIAHMELHLVACYQPASF